MFKGGNEASPAAGNKDRFSVFVVDDSLTELQKVKKYVQSQLPLQRLVYVKRLTACARSVGIDETVVHICPLLRKIASDSEAVIRQELGKELGALAVYCSDPAAPFEVKAGTDDEDLAEILGRTSDGKEGKTEAKATEGAPAPASPTASASASASTSTSAAASTSTSASTSTAAAASTSTSAASSTSSDSAASSTSAATSLSPSSPVAEASTSASTSTSTSASVSSSSSASTSSSSPSSSSSSSSSTSSPSSSSTSSTSTPAGSSSSSGAASPVSSSVDQLSAKELRALAESKSAEEDAAGAMTDVQKKGYQQIRDIIIPCLELLIVDNSMEVRQMAGQSLVQVASVLRGDDVGKIVLTLVLNLAHDERDEQRSTAVHLMNELAPLLGRDLCMNFVALELTAFADDATFRVRKATAQSFGNVCKVVGPTFTVNRLLPPYVKLSKDMIWGVRKGCVDSMVAVAGAVPPDVRKTVFIPMFERFAKDASRWVRNGAFEILGPFLHTLGSKLIRKSFLKHFTSVPSLGHAVVDAEVNYHCAYNFPAVVLTMGPARWLELVDCFETLAKDSKFPVRRSLACSLHEIAKVLKTSLTERYLLPVMDAFLKDLDEVRFGVIKNFSQIIKIMSPLKRKEYIHTLWEVQASDNWRWRQHIARQMGRLAILYPPDLTVKSMMPLTFALCRDRVAAVRVVAAAAVGPLVQRLLRTCEGTALRECCALVLAFGNSRIYHERQLFVRMCHSMLGVLDQKVFEDEFLTTIVGLASDRTVNVRLQLANFTAALMKHPALREALHVRGMLAVLIGDADRDVVRYSKIGAPDHEGEDRDVPDKVEPAELEEILATERAWQEGSMAETVARPYKDGDADSDEDDETDGKTMASPTGAGAAAKSAPAKAAAVTSPVAAAVRRSPSAPTAAPTATAEEKKEEKERVPSLGLGALVLESAAGPLSPRRGTAWTDGDTAKAGAAAAGAGAGAAAAAAKKEGEARADTPRPPGGLSAHSGGLSGASIGAEVVFEDTPEPAAATPAVAATDATPTPGPAS